MKLAESLLEWTEWTRENILPRPSLPLISSRDIDRVGDAMEVFWTAPAEIRESLETFLARNFDDLAARFVVLSFLWELIHLEWDFGDVEAEQRSGFREILKDMVCLVEPDQLADPKVISWEIVNASSVSAWDLGSRLYSRLKESAGLSESRFRALRGQFLYLVGDWEPYWQWTEDDEEKDLSYWSPELPGETLNSYAICVGATVPPERYEERPNQSQLARLEDAANDLKQAIDSDSSLPVLLRLMLAKCSLFTEVTCPLKTNPNLERESKDSGVCKEAGNDEEAIHERTDYPQAEGSRS